MNPTNAPTIVRDRFLLSPANAEFAEGVLLVSCGDAMGDDLCDVKIELTAPGLREADLDQIRSDLVDRLRGGLKPTVPGDRDIPHDELKEEDYANQSPWYHKVSIEPHFDTGVPLIVVAINDSDFMGYGSTDAVMSTVRGLLIPVARYYSQRLVVLTGNQRLVPLFFEMDDMRRTGLSVDLPPGLELITGRRAGDKYDEDPARRAHLSLEHTLDVELGLYDTVTRVHVRGRHDGTTVIDVSFNDRQYAKAGAINAVQQVIARVVAMHARYKGFYTNLAIMPAYAVYDEDGDGDEGAFFHPEDREY